MISAWRRSLSLPACGSCSPSVCLVGRCGCIRSLNKPQCFVNPGLLLYITALSLRPPGLLTPCAVTHCQTLLHRTQGLRIITGVCAADTCGCQCSVCRPSAVYASVKHSHTHGSKWCVRGTVLLLCMATVVTRECVLFGFGCHTFSDVAFKSLMPVEI